MHIRCHGNRCSRLQQGPYERGNYSLVTDKEKKVKAKPRERERQECSKLTGKATKAFTLGRGHFSSWLWIQVLICHSSPWQALPPQASKAAGSSPSPVLDGRAMGSSSTRSPRFTGGCACSLLGCCEKSLGSALLLSTKSIIKACFWNKITTKAHVQ